MKYLILLLLVVFVGCGDASTGSSGIESDPICEECICEIEEPIIPDCGDRPDVVWNTIFERCVVNLCPDSDEICEDGCEFGESDTHVGWRCRVNY